ncbi:MAG TPA: amidohydrolase [Acetobacteraceae bacterium]
MDQALAQNLTAWRRHLHAHPGLTLNEGETAAFVAARLREMGVEVTEGVGGHGVVGTIRRGGNRSVGLRGDMDALPIQELNPELPHRSTIPGVMHACGHDGHTAALLAAAEALAGDPAFSGVVHFIFQPAEEHGRGMQAMLDDGLLERFPMDEAYGLHIMPGLPLGRFATRAGPVMAAEDNFTITVHGRGGHAARPHTAIDPILAASAIVLALQGIVARRLDPVSEGVVSVTEFTTDGTRNVIPTTAILRGDCRSYTAEVSALIEAEMRRIAEGTAAAHGAMAELAYTREFIPTTNAPGPTEAAQRAAGDGAGPCAPVMASEDFARLLARVPGNFTFVGNGDSAGLHNPAFEFNDEALPHMVGYYLRLVRDRLAVSAGA